MQMEKEFWESVYQSGQTRFDLGAPTVPFVDFLEGAKLAPGRALVPGCGRGYDVLELARRGWDALGIDFAPSAIHDARAAAAKAELSEKARLKTEPVQLWWENTCYCAIPPARRDDYAEAAARLIAPDGLLVFLVFPCDGRAGGPPFAIDPAEIKPRFSNHFLIESFRVPPRPSTAVRAKAEQLAVLRRKR
jgi:SAM-dependent methyltransferase